MSDSGFRANALSEAKKYLGRHFYSEARKLIPGLLPRHLVSSAKIRHTLPACGLAGEKARYGLRRLQRGGQSSRVKRDIARFYLFNVVCQVSGGHSAWGRNSSECSEHGAFFTLGLIFSIFP